MFNHVGKRGGCDRGLSYKIRRIFLLPVKPVLDLARRSCSASLGLSLQTDFQTINIFSSGINVLNDGLFL